MAAQAASPDDCAAFGEVVGLASIVVAEGSRGLLEAQVLNLGFDADTAKADADSVPEAKVDKVERLAATVGQRYPTLARMSPIGGLLAAMFWPAGVAFGKWIKRRRELAKLTQPEVKP